MMVVPCSVPAHRGFDPEVHAGSPQTLSSSLSHGGMARGGFGTFPTLDSHGPHTCGQSGSTH